MQCLLEEVLSPPWPVKRKCLVTVSFARPWLEENYNTSLPLYCGISEGVTSPVVILLLQLFSARGVRRSSTYITNTTKSEPDLCATLDTVSRLVPHRKRHVIKPICLADLQVTRFASQEIPLSEDLVTWKNWDSSRSLESLPQAERSTAELRRPPPPGSQKILNFHLLQTGVGE